MEDVRLAAPSNQRLNLSSANHFVSNNFRSVCCHGHSNEEVSLEEFNSLCLLPSANWTSRIDFLEDSATIILPSPVDSAFSASNCLLEQKHTLLGENVVILLKNMRDAHPEREFINEHFPRTACPLWSLAMPGLKKITTRNLLLFPILKNFVVGCLHPFMVQLPRNGPSRPPNFFRKRMGFCGKALTLHSM